MTEQQKLRIEGISFEFRALELFVLPGANSLGQRAADRPTLRFESMSEPPTLPADSNQSNGAASAIDSVEAIGAKPEDRASVEGNLHVLHPCRPMNNGWALSCRARRPGWLGAPKFQRRTLPRVD